MLGRQRHSRTLLGVKVLQQKIVRGALLCNCRKHSPIVESCLMTTHHLTNRAWIWAAAGFFFALLLASPQTRSEEIKVHGWPGPALRVAHGPALGGYVGASIELTLPPTQQLQTPLQAWLVLVETLPAGFEGSPVPRNLVRNVFQPTWNKRDALSNSERLSFKEIRPLNIPQGAKSERLRVLGWVQDATGRVTIAAESICPPAEPN